MIIRQFEQNDIPEILNLWQNFMQYLVEINDAYYELKDGKNAFKVHLEKIDSDVNTTLLVCEINREIVGFIYGYVESLSPWFGSAQIGIIRYLAVSDRAQKMGVGKALFNAIQMWFKMRGISRLELYVLNGLTANDFWEKMGFTTLMERKYLNI